MKYSKENFPFYAFTSIISPDTSSVSDAQGNEEGGGGSGAANAPVEGLYFFHTDHLGSVTMLTNTAGEVVTGTSIGFGRSMVSYTPYGEIDRVHSGGPDIYRYKYTGQEEDKETGLYYYKARYYDPKIGRFLQPDTVLQTSSPFGTNQYMYVEGNPVMYNDPSGHISWKKILHMGNQIQKHIAGGTKGISHTWNVITKGKHYNQKTLSERNIKNGFTTVMKTGFALSCPIGSFLLDPAYTMGVYYTTVSFAAAYMTPYGIYNQIKNGPTRIENRGGGYVIHNSPLVMPKLGITLGPFAHVGAGASKNTIRHEIGHIQQYNNWGGWKYIGHGLQSLLQMRNSPWIDNDADRRSWTYEYPYIKRRNLLMTILLSVGMNNQDYIYYYLIALKTGSLPFPPL